MLKFVFSFFLVLFCKQGEMSVCLGLLFFFLFFLLPLYTENSYFFFEFDFLNWNLILLSVWLIIMCIFSSTKIFFLNKFFKFYLVIMSSLLFFLFLTFLSSNFLFFYFMFESCLIPILLMILGWGYQPERSLAGIYMFFYTLLGSLPLFLVIMYMNYINGGSYMYKMCEINNWGSNLIFLFLVSAFLVKFPMYSVHLWLLKAHVEAPVAGSMILAGVLLKLGGYGLIRFSCFFNDWFFSSKEFIIVLSLWGSVVLSISCLRFMDMKLLIATSSVVHMGGCISGIFILTDWGIKGCLVMMIAHGLCSSGLFCLANMVYERTNSRSMFINKGLLNILPGFSLWWFLLIVGNMAGPPSYNLLGEIMLLISVVNWSLISIMMLMVLGFFSGAYSLYLYSLSQHGVFVKIKSSIMNGQVLEYFLLLLHWAPMNLMVLGCSFMLFLM